MYEPHWVPSMSLSLNDELFKQVKASESPRSISILASSSVSGVTASWGKGIIEIKPPPALCLWPSQPSQPSQLLEPPRCLTEQPTRRTESKEAPGTPLIVHALGSSLASQHEEGPQSQGCPTAPHSVLTHRFWGRYSICFEALCFCPMKQLEFLNVFENHLLMTWPLLVLQGIYIVNFYLSIYSFSYLIIYIFIAVWTHSNV